MEDNGKNRETSGNLLAIRNDKDSLIVDMKLKGCSNREIAEATEIKLKTLQNIISKGGRLYPVIQSLRSEKTIVLQQGNLSGLESLLEAKNPAIQELIRLIQESPNDIVRLRGIDMLLEMTGIRSTDRPPLLDPLDMNKSVERRIKWENEQFQKVYQDKAPVISLWTAGSEGHLKYSKDDIVRLEKITEEMRQMRERPDRISGLVKKC